MRISDWSSDVCSSDLPTARLPGARETVPVELELHNEPLPLSAPFRIAGHVFEAMPAPVVTLRDGDYIGRGEAPGVYYNDDHPQALRSDGRPVGKECDSTYSSRWSRDH